MFLSIHAKEYVFIDHENDKPICLITAIIASDNVLIRFVDKIIGQLGIKFPSN